jgi:hypothetical protein
MKPPCGHATWRAILILRCGNHAASDAQRQGALACAKVAFFR